MAIPLSLLILEDDPQDTILAIRQLERAGYAPAWERVETASAFAAALTRQPWELILADFNLPTFDGLAALAMVLARQLDIPFILMSGQAGEDLAIDSLKAGATEYLRKERLERLGYAVRRALAEQQERRRRRQAEDALSHFFESAPIGLLRATPEGRILAANPALAKILAQDVADLPGQSLQEFLRADLPLDALEVGARPQVWEGQLRQGRWVRLTVSAVCDPSDMDYLEAAIEDISEAVETRAGEAAQLRLSLELRAADDGAAVLHALLAELAHSLHLERALALLFEPESGQLRLQQRWGPGALPVGMTFDSRTAGMAEVLRRSASLALDDIHTSPYRSPFTPPDLPPAVLITPLLAKSVVLGVALCARQAPYTPREQRLAEALCEQAAVALQRTRLHTQTELRLRQLQTLHDVDLAINADLALDRMLEVILAQVEAWMPQTTADIYLWSAARRVLECKIRCGGPEPFAAPQNLPALTLDEGMAGWVAARRRPVLLPELAAAPLERLAAQGLGHIGLAYYGVPLLVKGQIKGVLEIFAPTPAHFNPETCAFLDTLAERIAVAVDNGQLFDNMQRANLELSVAYDETIEGWSRALDLRDRETEGHTQRVALLTLKLARRLDYPDEALAHLWRGALLHDIGKMGIPDSILQKPGPLSEVEWQVMKLHPGLAGDMLAGISFLRPALDIPLNHHEKWDGSGYPQGLRGEAIPRAARIFAVVDVWDALTSDRAYRPAWTNAAALEYIISQSGQHFEPRVAEVFRKELAGVEARLLP